MKSTTIRTIKKMNVTLIEESCALFLKGVFHVYE